MSVQNELEKCLEMLEKKINLKVLRLNARENIELLHQKIKEFIDD